MKKIKLKYALNLQKIMESGQCFRPVNLKNGRYRFINGNRILYCRQESDFDIFVSCGREEWDDVWTSYFDLDNDYDALCEASEETEFLKAAVEYGRGIRVLRQDPFEMLISFILSQRKSIPAIRTAIEKLCDRYGEAVETSCEMGEVRLFPRPEALEHAGTEGLLSCGLGYRAPYVRDAAERVSHGTLSLREAEFLDDSDLFQLLCTVHGVGEKVACCVMLFAYGRYESVPSDVWIQRIVEKKYAGEAPFSSWRGAGILQQYLFYYALKHKEEFVK